MGPYHHGMARPRVRDVKMASTAKGSGEYIE